MIVREVSTKTIQTYFKNKLIVFLINKLIKTKTKSKSKMNLSEQQINYRIICKKMKLIEKLQANFLILRAI